MSKKIVLLADGTGNGRLVQVSNICRLSKALVTSRSDQVVYYIPGVGTEGFKPLALLDGATGLGVPANVRKLYRFLSWNWTPDAAIYMFGFSRGAFTIRMLVDLISKEGLLPTEIDGRRVSHQEMVRNSEDAWRAYCEKDDERKKNIWVKAGLPKVRDAVLGAWKRLRRQPSYADIQAKNLARRPENLSIEFLGLFDTVEAYGVPIEEMREAIHSLVYPIKFGGDHRIWTNVRRVRQALSLDDERRTFHPIRVSLEPGDAESRIQEAWFAGVHSDVGGGYPDDMTAHCPLLWMIGEAQKTSDAPARALILHDEALEEFKRTATPFGPLHDSRAGTAVLYRYDPRQVMLADPRGNPYYRPTVHYTVVQRLVDGSDDYAPLALGEIKQDATEAGPRGADVVMPDGAVARAETGLNYALIRKGDSEAKPAILRSDSRDLVNAQVAMRSLDAPDREEMELARDYIWLNRIAYIFFVALFIVVLALPVLDGTIDDVSEGIWSSISLITVPFQWLLGVLGPVGDALSRFALGSANVLHGVGHTILIFTPSYLYAHVQAVLNHPLFSIALVLGYFILRYKSNSYQDATRYHARLAWNVQHDRIKKGDEREPGMLSKFVHRLRTSPALGSVRGIRQGILPSAYKIAFLVVAVVVINRIGFNYLEGSGRVCVSHGSPQWLTSESKRFTTSDPCWASGWALEHGGVYRLTISIDPRKDDPWLDQLMLTDPYGFEGKGWWHSVGVMFRRWPSAAWFQPIARIGSQGDVEWPLVPLDGGGALSPRGRRCSTLPLDYSATAEHKSFCEDHPKSNSCIGGSPFLAVSTALSPDELDSARAAWRRDSFPYENGESCYSPFPRKEFVSEFVARGTGELFLFVNDAVHVSLDGRRQLFYDNNTGTATVVLERLPRAAVTATASPSQ